MQKLEDTAYLRLARRAPKGACGLMQRAWQLLGQTLAVAASSLYLSSPVFADVYQAMANQRNMLPGGRAALMGGAFTAIADDASGSFYNPAGLSFARVDLLEASGTAYRSDSTIYEEAIAGESFVERSAVIYPSFLGGTARLGPVTVGYAYLTLDARNVYQQNSYDDISTFAGATKSYSRTYQEASTYNWLGGSLALRLGKQWSLGVSAFYYQRTIEFLSSEMVRLNGGGLVAINDTLTTLNTGLAVVYGLVWHGESLAVGLVARLPRALSNHSQLHVEQVHFAAPAAEAASAPAVSTDDRPHRALNELNPATFGLGLAWTAGRWATLAADVLLHDGVKSPFRDEGGHDLHQTLNYSVGVELDLQLVRLLGGWFTNHSLYRRLRPAKTNQPSWIDFQGFSAGVGWDVGGIVGQLGVVKQQGRGEAQILTDSLDIQKTHAESTTFLISGKVPL